MLQSTRAGMWLAAIVLLAFSAFLQHKIDPMRHQFEPINTQGERSGEQALPVEFALGAAVGFREAIAGLLWVRTDEFFHEGNYDAIIPMVRIITWLDPHFTDVYLTGAWHLDYNFTDQNQRSDRRYIPFALALLKEGIRNNPTNTTMMADLALTHYYRKIVDYPQAVYWFEKGQAVKDDPAIIKMTNGKIKDDWDVVAVGHGLAHAYEAEGEVDKAIAEWKLVLAEHQRRYANQGVEDTVDHAGINSAKKNLYEMILRKKWRANVAKNPLDVEFHPVITRIAPMVFMFTGDINLLGSKDFKLEDGSHTTQQVVGAKVEIRLEDADYKFPKEQELTLSSVTPKDVTIMQDLAPTKLDGHNHLFFKKRIDMSADHIGADAMYPFKADRYKLTLWINPGSTWDTPLELSDRIGWIGEGWTDKNYLDTSGSLPGTNNAVVPGMRMIKRVYYLTRDDIMGQGIKQFN